MKKIVKKMGNSLWILLDGDDKLIYDIEEGDIIDIEIKKVEKDENSFHRK